MVDLFSHEENLVLAKNVPEQSRYVYLVNGVETQDATKATEKIPITEVDMAPLDAQGNLTSKNTAVVIAISEYGPDKKLLRHTTLVPKTEASKSK